MRSLMHGSENQYRSHCTNHDAIAESQSRGSVGVRGGQCAATVEPN